MKTRITLLPVKLIAFLLAWLFSQLVSAQHNIVSIEGYWLNGDKGLLLQEGYYWMHSKEKLPQSGAYSFDGNYIILGEANDRQVFRVIKKKQYLLLLGTEVQIRLESDKDYPSDKILLGRIRPVIRTHTQNTVLPLAFR